MSRFFGKKLPPHWVYVPSRRQVRDLLRVLAADVRCVEFAATGHPRSIGLRLGYLECRVAAGAWCFYLRLWGVPESAVAERRDELAREALQAIDRSVAECRATPAASVTRPTQLHLLFQVGTDGVISRCSVEPVDQYSFSAGSWWISPNLAQQGDPADVHTAGR